MTHHPTGTERPFEGIAPLERRAVPPGPGQARPVATWALLVAMGLGYGLAWVAAVTPGQGVFGGPSLETLMALGATMSDQVLVGNWHHLLTNWYLHGNIGHLVFNGLALLYAGSALERWTGRAWLLTVFCVSELGGSLLSALMNDGVVSYGASGAIMGVLGATYLAGHRLTDAPGRDAVKRGTMLMLILTLIPMPSALGAVDHWSHLGGAIAGLAFALALHPVWPGARVRRAWMDGVGRATVALMAAAILLQVGPYAGIKGDFLVEAQQAEAAVGWYRFGERLGDRRSAQGLGFAYWIGRGAPQDLPRAFALIHREAMAGSPWAQRSLARMYERGEGTTADREQAIAWLRKAAEAGDATAQTDLAEAYFEGNGVKADATLARQWLEKADAQNHVDAACSLGFEYLNAKHLKQDYAKALHYFQRAADQESADARTNLGYMYYEGLGTRKDFAKAFAYTRQAADQGEAYAQFNLGEMYELGRGVAKDRQLAYQWYDAASRHPDLDADTRKEVAGILARLAKAIGPQAVTAARARAKARE
jgi:TPR repeat protein/membrane associated rhomboid family serine protease